MEHILAHYVSHYLDNNDLARLKRVCKYTNENIDVFSILHERDEIKYKRIFECARVDLLQKYHKLVDFTNKYVMHAIVKYRMVNFYDMLQYGTRVYIRECLPS